MPKKQALQDLSIDELRWLLMEKRRVSRHERIERYRRTGRVVMLASDMETPSLESWHTGLLTDQDDAAPAKPRSRGRRILNGFLLVVEIGAVLGFIFILFNGLTVIQELNREVATSLEQPTLSPTPVIRAVVLPSGHTPPTSPGGSQFNEAEIPAYLRPMVQSFSNVALPTPGPEQAVRLQIPAIGVNQQVVQGDSWEQLKKGIGQHAGTANPGEKGNVVLSGHNDVFGEFFRYLDQLKPGDVVTLYTNQRSYTYVVVDTQIVEPSQVSVMDSTSQPTVSLISCYPYLIDNKRIVVTARLQGSESQ
ncbi:MAG TPA: class D sortase [Anaerolineales bacterium]